MPTMANAPTAAQLSAALVAQNLPTPSPSFLSSILTPTSASQRLPPLPALIATAKHRILSSDLTTLLAPSNLSLPADISNVRITTRTLNHDIFVQVLDIDDLSRSKWDQIEALESERKGETTKGREIIRVVASADGEGDAATQALPGAGPNSAVASRGKGPFKVLLEDGRGSRVYGFELKRVEKIAYPPVMGIGCKLILRKGAHVARGIVLLEPASVIVVGGRMEALDKQWREKREVVLRDRVKVETEERSRENSHAR